MPVPRHLEEAADRLAAAERRIRIAKELAPSLKSLQEWLDALTDYAIASSDIQRFTNESVHEKLHELAGRTGIGPFQTGPPATEPP